MTSRAIKTYNKLTDKQKNDIMSGFIDEIICELYNDAEVYLYIAPDTEKTVTGIIPAGVKGEEYTLVTVRTDYTTWADTVTNLLDDKDCEPGDHIKTLSAEAKEMLKEEIKRYIEYNLIKNKCL